MDADNIALRVSQCRESIQQTTEALEANHVMGEALNGAIAEIALLLDDVGRLKRLLETREKAPA